MCVRADREPLRSPVSIPLEINVGAGVLWVVKARANGAIARARHVILVYCRRGQYIGHELAVLYWCIVGVASILPPAKYTGALPSMLPPPFFTLQQR